MKKALIVVAVIALGVVIYVLFARSARITIEVTGTVGAKFVGTCEVDGAVRDLSGTVPAHFEITGRKVDWTIAPVAPDVTFDVGMDVGGGFGGTIRGGVPMQPVQGWFEATAGGREHWIGNATMEHLAKKLPGLAKDLRPPR